MEEHAPRSYVSGHDQEVDNRGHPLLQSIKDESRGLTNLYNLPPGQLHSTSKYMGIIAW
jgi:hypothetical protein